MPRIDIELTSARPDGTWTWRAAGARQPKGVVDGSVLHAGAKVGDVVRAETEVELDGIAITSVIPPKARRPGPERLSLVAPAHEEPLVRGPERLSEREGRGRGAERDRRRPGADAGPRHRASPSDRRDGAPKSNERGGPGRKERRTAPSQGGRDAPPRRDRRDGTAAAGRASRGSGGPPPGDGVSSGPRRSGDATRLARERPKRFHPGRAHRDAVLAALAPEQRPVAEQMLRGGIPAVRQAVEDQNKKARDAGEPEIRADALLAMAEGLLPKLRWAEWRDRADAAVADVEGVSLRDLRAVVAGSDVARDDESRDIAVRLRQALDRRTAAESESWLDDISTSLTEGRVVRALRASARPPQPGVRFPADLANRLSAAAAEAMTPETTPDRWAALLEAVCASPVRRSVQPKGLPPAPGEELLKAVRQAVGRVPALAQLVGVAGERPARPPRPPDARPPDPATASSTSSS